MQNQTQPRMLIKKVLTFYSNEVLVLNHNNYKINNHVFCTRMKKYLFGGEEEGEIIGGGARFL